MKEPGRATHDPAMDTPLPGEGPPERPGSALDVISVDSERVGDDSYRVRLEVAVRAPSHSFAISLIEARLGDTRDVWIG